MGPEFITLLVDGGLWSAFRRCAVSASLDAAARNFRIDVAFEPGATATAAIFRAGATLTILANGAPLLTGFVDRYRPSGDRSLQRATIEGRSRGADAIDGAALHTTGRFEDKTLLDIAQELDAAGVGFTASADLPTIPRAQIRPGESLFQMLERYARAQNITLRGLASGGIDFYDAQQAPRHAGGLVEGVNLLTWEADHNWSERHSRYIVRGQKLKGFGADALEIEAIAKDEAVGRNRPLIIIAPDDIDEPRAKREAKHRRDRRAGRSLSANVSVQGFRDDGGEIWEPGRLIYVESAGMNLQGDMLVESVSFTQDSDGSIAQLGLVDPRAYNGKKARGAKSGGDWKAGDDDADLTPPED